MASVQTQPFHPPTKEYLLSLFNNVDKDHSGYITAEELQVALSNGTWTPFNPKTVRSMISMFDKEKKGVINFDSFASLWKYITDWQACFRSFDRDNSGTIDRNELSEALSQFGYRLNEDVSNVLFKTFDRFSRGTVLFDDFIHCCITLSTLTNTFRQYDQDQDGVITIDYNTFLKMVLELKL